MSQTVKVCQEEIRLEPFSGLKATYLIRCLEEVGKQWPEIHDARAEFRRSYSDKNARYLTRTEARAQFGPETLMDEKPVIHKGRALKDEDGNVLVERTPKLDEENRPIIGPDPLSHMTELDWEASDHKLRLPGPPPGGREELMAILPQAMNLAKEQVLQVLALVAMSESDLDRYEREESIEERLTARGKELLRAPLSDLLRLAAAAGAQIEEELKVINESIGGDLPNVFRLLGADLSSQTDDDFVSESKVTEPTSSTASQPRTGGSRKRSSEPAGAVSSPSDGD